MKFWKRKWRWNKFVTNTCCRASKVKSNARRKYLCLEREKNTILEKKLRTVTSNKKENSKCGVSNDNSIAYPRIPVFIINKNIIKSLNQTVQILQAIVIIIWPKGGKSALPLLNLRLECSKFKNFSNHRVKPKNLGNHIRSWRLAKICNLNVSV